MTMGAPWPYEVGTKLRWTGPRCAYSDQWIEPGDIGEVIRVTEPTKRVVIGGEVFEETDGWSTVRWPSGAETAAHLDATRYEEVCESCHEPNGPLAGSPL